MLGITELNVAVRMLVAESTLACVDLALTGWTVSSRSRSAAARTYIERLRAELTATTRARAWRRGGPRLSPRLSSCAPIG